MNRRHELAQMISWMHHNFQEIMIIGTSEIYGDSHFVKFGTQYFDGIEGLDAAIGSTIKSSYGANLRLILVDFYFEGIHSSWKLDAIRIGRYSAKDQSIAIKIPVRISEFHTASREDRKRFLIDSIEIAVGLAKKRLLKNASVTINWPQLEQDIATLRSNYLAN